MPYIIVKTCWPSHQVPEVVKKAIEQIKKFPEDSSLGETILPNAVKATTDGFKTISVTEAAKGKFEELYARAGEIMQLYAPIEGFEYSIEVWATVAEAFATIGQTPPE